MKHPDILMTGEGSMTNLLRSCLAGYCSCGKFNTLFRESKAVYEMECKALIDKCKQEAKQLAEFTATRRKLHWSHPSFVSFCVSVEDVLSHGVKRRYHVSKSKPITSSGKILHDLGKTYPDAASIYAKCFVDSSDGQDDYTVVQTSSPAERKILWIRVAMIDGKLSKIVGEMLKRRRSYYTEQSVMCHPVYGEVFSYLLDGPCAIRFSRLKSSDTLAYNPSPAEIVRRHNHGLAHTHAMLEEELWPGIVSISISQATQQDGHPHIGTEEAWDHVRSMYQSAGSTCLFGKNNVLVRPAGSSEPLQGYLMLQMTITALMLRWIPNSLLQESKNTKRRNSLWDQIISVDIVHQIAHIHCHRTPGRTAEMTMIGFDGIAYPSIVFSHYPSLFHFLEHLENSLLPQGCLIPPLLYIKAQANKSKLGTALKMISGPPAEEERDWFEGLEGWSQVFRLRYGSKQQQENMVQSKPAVIEAPVPLPLNLEEYPHSQQVETSDSSSDSDSELPLSTPGIPDSQAKKSMEKMQAKVSKQLIARYFYSWLSYCRHMRKVRASVAHMINTSRLILDNDPAHQHPVLSEELWREFTEIRNEEKWTEIVKVVYLKGIATNELRAKVWPYLLGLYPVESTEEEKAAIDQQYAESYYQILAEWKEVDRIKKIIEKKEHAKRVTESGSILTSDSAESRQESRDATSVKQTEPVFIPKTKPLTSSARPHNFSPGSRTSSPSLYSISPDNSSADQDQELQTPTPTSTPNSLHNGAAQPEISKELQEHMVPHEPELGGQAQDKELQEHMVPHEPELSGQAQENTRPSVTVSVNDQGGGQGNLDKGNTNQADSDLVDGTTASSPLKSSVQSELTDVRPSEASEVGNGVGSAELAVIMETIVQVEEEEREERERGEGREKGADSDASEELLDSTGQVFAEELFKIDKDIPRCDRDYWYFKEPHNLEILRNIVSTYVWTHLDVGYSQGMCDLLAPLLVILNNETQTYAVFLKLMEVAIKLFPPNTAMNTRLDNLRELLQVLEPDYFQYLSERPLGDGLFYCYRWFLVLFKREFEYDDIFRLWETIWASRKCVSNHFEEFLSLGIMQQFRTAIMDAHLDPSDILNLFTDLADKNAIDCSVTIKLAQATIAELQGAITKN